MPTNVRIATEGYKTHRLTTNIAAAPRVSTRMCAGYLHAPAAALDLVRRRRVGKDDRPPYSDRGHQAILEDDSNR
jgi:hypothetical protein